MGIHLQVYYVIREPGVIQKQHRLNLMFFSFLFSRHRFTTC